MTRKENLKATLWMYVPLPDRHNIGPFIVSVLALVYSGLAPLLAMLATYVFMAGVRLLAIRVVSRRPLYLMTAARFHQILHEIKARVASGETQFPDAFCEFESRAGAWSALDAEWIHEIGVAGLVAAVRHAGAGVIETGGTRHASQIAPFPLPPVDKRMLN